MPRAAFFFLQVLGGHGLDGLIVGFLTVQPGGCTIHRSGGCVRQVVALAGACRVIYTVRGPHRNCVNSSSNTG